MTEFIIALVSSLVASVGFGLIMHERPCRLPFAALGGFLAYAIYYFVSCFVEGEFIPNLVAALLMALFSETCAHLLKAPTSLFLTTSIIPLVPGGNLYYSMTFLLEKNYEQFLESITETIEIGIGLAGGMTVGLTIASLFFQLIRSLSERRRKRSGTVK